MFSSFPVPIRAENVRKFAIFFLVASAVFPSPAAVASDKSDGAPSDAAVRRRHRAELVTCAARTIASNALKWAALHAADRGQFRRQLGAVPCVRRGLRRIEDSDGRKVVDASSYQAEPGHGDDEYHFGHPGDGGQVVAHAPEASPTDHASHHDGSPPAETALEGGGGGGSGGVEVVTESEEGACELTCPMDQVNQVYTNLVKCFTQDILCCTCIFFVGMGMVEAFVNESDGLNGPGEGGQEVLPGLNP